MSVHIYWSWMFQEAVAQFAGPVIWMKGSIGVWVEDPHALVSRIHWARVGEWYNWVLELVLWLLMDHWEVMSWDTWCQVGKHVEPQLLN